MDFDISAVRIDLILTIATLEGKDALGCEAGVHLRE